MSETELSSETTVNDMLTDDVSAGELDSSAENLPLKPLSAGPTSAADAELDLDMLMEVPVTLSVEIGTNKMPIKQLVSLNQGSVVDLERDINEPMNLLVNGTLIARGEVVVIGQKFGLRVVDILSPKDRLRNLR